MRTIVNSVGYINILNYVGYINILNYVGYINILNSVGYINFLNSVGYINIHAIKKTILLWELKTRFHKNRTISFYRGI